MLNLRRPKKAGSQLKVLMATGGTGGHLFPSQQLAELLQGEEVVFAGYKLEKTPFFQRKHPYHEIASAPSIKKWPSLLKGVFQSLKLLFRFNPDLVVGFGSFYAFPVLVAAVLLRKKIVLFEPNCTMGKVNRILSPFAEKIAFQFSISHPKAIYVPLLPWNKKRGAKKYEKDPDRTTILVFGGSQGATFINRTFCEAVKLLTFPVRIIHLTGKEPCELEYAVPATVKPFEEEMESAYEVADFVVCRCGAGTTAELIAYRKPAIVIPYPGAYGHQEENGKYLRNGVRLLLQKQAHPRRLAEEMEKLKAHLETHVEALKQIPLPQAIGFDVWIRTLGEKK